MHTFMGLLLILTVVFLLIWGKINNIIVFIIVPTIAGLIVTGFNYDLVGKIVSEGVASMGNIASLFVFSMLFFNIMSDAGIFDALIKKLINNSGKSVIMIVFITAFISIISHLDGVGTTTIVITIGAMLPVYKKIGIRTEILLVTLFLATGAFSYLPWNPAMIFSGSVINMDPSELFRQLLPVQFVGFVSSFSCIYLLAKIENKRLIKLGYLNDKFSACDSSNGPEIAASIENLNKPLLYFNIIFTLLVIIGLIFGVFPANHMFMVASAVALFVNFKHDEQHECIKKYGANIMIMVGTVFAIGVFTAVLNETGMINAMTQSFIKIMPEALGTKLHFVIALISVPLTFFLGHSPLIFALLPIISSITVQYGLGVTPAATAILIGTSYGSGLSPTVAPLFFALSSAELEYGSYLKFAFRWLLLAGIVTVLLSGIFGFIPT